MKKYWEAGAHQLISRAKRDGRVVDVAKEARRIGDLYADAPEVSEIARHLISVGVTARAGLHLGRDLDKPAP